MIAYLIGTITEQHENGIVLEVNGIGYDVAMPYHELTKGIKLGEVAKVYIYEHRKEDALDFYGFLSKDPKEIFQKLLTVSGIGPKGALQMLHMYPTDELIRLILSEDVKALSKVNGIGPKTAQRILLELKDTMRKYSLKEEVLIESFTPLKASLKDEAVEALTVLGYDEKRARDAVKAVYVVEDTTESLIKKALSLLGS
jgi:Holliday junction DNA helicase RuvA